MKPDIFVHEVVHNDSHVYGSDLRDKLPKGIPEWAALKIIQTRMFEYSKSKKMSIKKKSHFKNKLHSKT